ncbi:hypothetical protein KI387_036753, partial [Taxus chinensis]
VKAADLWTERGRRGRVEEGGRGGIYRVWRWGSGGREAAAGDGEGQAATEDATVAGVGFGERGGGGSVVKGGARVWGKADGAAGQGRKGGGGTALAGGS